VDLREAVLVALRELLVLHPVAPVRVARGEPSVRRHLVELRRLEDLEDRVEEVEAERLREVPDAGLHALEVVGKVAHRLTSPSPGTRGWSPGSPRGPGSRT